MAAEPTNAPTSWKSDIYIYLYLNIFIGGIISYSSITHSLHAHCVIFNYKIWLATMHLLQLQYTAWARLTEPMANIQLLISIRGHYCVLLSISSTFSSHILFQMFPLNQPAWGSRAGTSWAAAARMCRSWRRLPGSCERLDKKADHRFSIYQQVWL